MTSEILCIFGPGLGRLVHATGAATALRRHYTGARITAVTSPEAAEFARSMPYFDAVIADHGAPWWRFSEIAALRAALTERPFSRIYDFDGGARSRLLCRLIHGWRAQPAERGWSLPAAQGMHIADRMAQQLIADGIVDVPPPDLGWVARTVKSYSTPFKMTEPFALICADAGRSGAPALAFIIAAAQWYVARGLTPLLVGETAQPQLADDVMLAAPGAKDITGRAPAGDLVFLAWGAHSAIGADSGISVLLANAGCKTVILCGAASDPAVDGPRGANVAVLQRESIAAIGFPEASRLIDVLGASRSRVS